MTNHTLDESTATYFIPKTAGRDAIVIENAPAPLMLGLTIRILIKSHFNFTSDIATAYVAGAIVTLTYALGDNVWQDHHQ
jgi:hypothetical protein